jgi:hypothetical protein
VARTLNPYARRPQVSDQCSKQTLSQTHKLFERALEATAVRSAFTVLSLAAEGAGVARSGVDAGVHAGAALVGVLAEAAVQRIIVGATA